MHFYLINHYIPWNITFVFGHFVSFQLVIVWFQFYNSFQEFAIFATNSNNPRIISNDLQLYEISTTILQKTGKSKKLRGNSFKLQLHYTFLTISVMPHSLK